MVSSGGTDGGAGGDGRPGDGRSDDDRRAFWFDLELLQNPEADGAAREAEWTRVFDHFHPRLHDHFSKRLRDADAVDDLLGTLWPRAMRGLPDLRHVGGAWNWLRRVGENLEKDGRRRDATRARREDTWAREEIPDAELPDFDADARDGTDAGLRAGGAGGAPGGGWDGLPPGVDTAAVLAEIDAFSLPDRDILHLRLIDGMEHDAIAERVGLRTPTVRQRFSRARRQLATRLREIHQDDRPKHDDDDDV
jgi:RNA polymerase sigma factor (sigma-70 family)